MFVDVDQYRENSEMKRVNDERMGRKRLGLWSVTVKALMVVVVMGWGAGEARAEIPNITWDSNNDGLSAHNNGPLTRTWGWSCDDPSDQFPLNQRCRVYDITGLPHGTLTGAVLLDDVDCGQAMSDPTSVVHDYDVPAAGLLSDHKYAYAAYCQDSDPNGANSYTSWYWFWYDNSPPGVAVLSGPQDPSDATEVSFEISCDDASFGYDFGSITYEPQCYLLCALVNDTNDATVVPMSPCDTPSVTDATQIATHSYAFLPEGTYRFQVYGQDQVGLLSNLATYTWTVDLPDSDGDGIADSVDNCPRSVQPGPGRRGQRRLGR